MGPVVGSLTVCLVLVLSLNTRAIAFADLGSCDVVNLRADSGYRQALGEDAFSSYESTLRAAFQKRPDTASLDRLAEAILIAQRHFLSEAASRIEPQLYLSSAACQLIESLNDNAKNALVGGNLTSESGLTAYRERMRDLLTRAADHQDDMLRRVRFRTPEARALFNAGYACFAASLVIELVRSAAQPPDLRIVGEPNSCQYYDRADVNWEPLRGLPE